MISKLGLPGLLVIGVLFAFFIGPGVVALGCFPIAWRAHQQGHEEPPRS